MERTTDGPAAVEDRRRTVSVTTLLVVVLIVAIVATGVVTAVAVGGDDGERAAGAGHEVFLQPADTVGHAPFGRIGRPTSTRVPPTTTSTTAARPANTVASVAGSSVGLYGGTLNVASCDRAQLATFLEQHPEKAAAWASVQGIRVAELRAYIDALTPVVLLHDTRVTNHGFRGGRATPHQAVLQAGTAVLVDRFGVLRARCYCGNPLTPPVALDAPVLVGHEWPAYSSTTVVVVVPRVVVRVFVLVDVRTGRRFGRQAGTAGARDVPTNGETADGTPILEDGDAGPGTTTTTTPEEPPVTDPAGTYTVQFSGEQLSPPCSPWGAGTGSMAVAVDGTTISIALARDGGTATQFAGQYDAANRTFSALDVQYGYTTLSGSFSVSGDALTVPDGRQLGHSATGGACIGAFIAVQTVG